MTLLASAQMPQTLPLDPKVKTGKLDNGLTYFVVKNSEPKGQAEFYIVQKVGSILEEESQRGLAHFLEHMCFNGSKNFPGNGIISYLEKIGVKFGENLNAYTSIDQTVYNISNVPVKRQGIIDSCLLILYDWSCAINLNNEDIDNERGVIREELRTRSSATMRMYEKILPEIYPGNRYGVRLPIGLLDVINNFSHQEIKDYYHKWYRPDLQGIIIVGDIDPVAIENQIKSLFSSVPKKANPAERTQFAVENNTDPIISIASDPESTSTEFYLMYKHDVVPQEFRPTVAQLAIDYMNNMVVSMMNSRLSELSQKADPPFTGAGAEYGDFFIAQTKDAFMLNVSARDGQLDRAVRTIVNEAERVRKYGFTASEYERARANYTSRMEKIYKERETQKNEFYVNNIVNHFLTGEAIPGIEMEYTMMQQIAPAITIDQVNTYAKSLPTRENVVMFTMMPQKEGLRVPTKEEMLALYESALKDSVEAYKETVSNEPLVPVAPKAGKVVKETAEPITGAVVWTLSNGATVVLKKTDFKEDQIVFTASSRGGYSLTAPEDVLNTKILNDVANLGGLGKFSAVDLRKRLAGKNVSINPSIGTNTEKISGSASPKDLETFMQLLYLSYTDIRKDDEAYNSFITRTKAQLQNMEAEPMMALQDTLTATLFSNNPYTNRLTLKDVDKLDYAKALQIVKERISNAADFTFVFVGNIDPATAKPLVETYIGSLPANKSKKEDWKSLKNTPAKGNIIKHFEKEMQTPKSSVYKIYTGKTAYNVENRIMADITKQVFDQVFTRSIREDEGGTYGVGVNMSVNYYPEDYFMFLYAFDTDVAIKDRLLARAQKEIDNVMANGIDKTDFSKVVEYMQKSYTQNQRENNYWLSVLTNRYLLGKDMHTTYEPALKNMTPEKVNSFIKSTLTQGNQMEIIMNGTKK